jgi:integrase
VRVVDLTPACGTSARTTLTAPHSSARSTLFFRPNVRQRVFVKAIERANVRLAALGIEPLGDVRPRGLRRTYASLRTACGDDPMFVSRQIGHTDVRFTLNVYAQSVKRRERMSAAEQGEYDRAVEWPSWASAPSSIGTTKTLPLLPA